jgi:HSP20 family molecular chaperone IbpA
MATFARWDPFRDLVSLSLPQTADAEKIEATFDKCVLRIEVPKVEAAKPMKISVKASA